MSEREGTMEYSLCHSIFQLFPPVIQHILLRVSILPLFNSLDVAEFNFFYENNK